MEPRGIIAKVGLNNSVQRSHITSNGHAPIKKQVIIT